MNIGNGGLGFVQTLDNEDFKRKLRESMKEINGFSAKSVASMDSIQVKASDLAKGIGAVFTVGAATNFIQEMVKVRGEFEQLEIAFTTMLGSKERADNLMMEIVDFAAKTPFGLQSTSEATKMLLAYGESAETALDTMRKLGDIASGVGIPLKDIAYLYGTTMTQGRLYTQDLNQFLGRGIPMMDELAKIFGVNKNEVKALVEEGKVGFPEVQKVIENLTASGSMFGGLMEAQSNSIAGQIEQLKDAFDVMLNDIGKESEGLVKSVIGGASTVVENYKEIAKVLGGVVAVYGAYRGALIATVALQKASVIAGNIQAYFQLATSIRSAKDAQLLFNMAVKANPYALAAAAIAGLIAILYNLRSELNLAEKSQKNITDANNEATKSIASEKAEVQRLITVAKDDRISKENRLQAIEKLNKISPQYLGNLNLENINTQLAVKATDAYTDALFKNAKAKAYQAKYDELVNKRLETSNKASNDYKDVVGKGFDYLFGETKGLKDYQDVLNEVTKTEGKIYKTQEARRKRADEIYKQLGLDKKKIELAQYDSQLIDLEKEMIKSLSDIQSVKTEIDQTVSTPAKTKTNKTATKKSDDPLEVFKKEVSTYKEQYERLTNYLNTKDKELNIAGEALKVTLSSKGQTYLDFLQKQAEQLRKSASSSELARKQLIVINDEIYSLLNQSQTEDFKKQIEKDLQSAQSLIERINLIKKAKEELTGKTDQISIDKLKFIDEKDLQNQFDVETYLKDETKKFEEQYQYLEVKRKEYDAEMLLLQEQYNKASNDSEKRRIQDLINIRSAQYFEDTNSKTNNVEVNRIIEESKSLAQKRLDIEREYAGKISLIQAQINSETSAIQLKLFTDVITEIERKQKEALQQVDGEIIRKSKSWVGIFSDYSRKSSLEIAKMITQIQQQLSNTSLTSTLSVEDIKALQDRLRELKDYLSKNDPFVSLGTSIQNMITKAKETGKVDFSDIRGAVGDLKNVVGEVTSMAEGLGIEISDSTASAIQLGSELLDAGMNIAEGIASKNPMQVVKGIVAGITSIINAGDRKKERQIQKYKQAVQELTRAFDQLQRSADKALGGDVYKDQEQMIKNLQQQQEQYRKMIDAEKGKKKTDNGKISEYEQAIIDAGNKINEIMDNITQDILQTTAKDLADTLGDALVDAFSKGEDAAKSFEKVANDVLKNAVLNQLKKNFLEKQLQSALDGLQEQMGVTGLGWNGLTAEQQQQFRDKIADISAGFTGALDAYADLFKDLEDADANSLSGAIKGVSEETASLIAGQMNAIRIMQAEGLEIHRNSNNVLIQQLDQLFRIEFNTRSITPMLERIHNVLNTESSRGWGH